MEEILNKLSEIEIAARGIMEDADRSKQTLSEEMEKKQKAFDSRLEQETDARIEQIRSDLEREKDTELTALRQNTEKAYKQLDSYYEKNHERLSRELFQKIINA